MITSTQISIRQQAVSTLSKVQEGKLSREKAEETLRDMLRHSSKTREDLIEELCRNYDAEAVKAFEYFRLI